MWEEIRGEEESKGYRGQKTASSDLTLTHGSVLSKRARTKPGYALKDFVLADANSDTVASVWSMKVIFHFTFFPTFAYKHFLLIFYTEQFEIHKKFVSKMNILLVNSLFLLPIFCHICYIYASICKHIYLFVYIS